MAKRVGPICRVKKISSKSKSISSESYWNCLQSLSILSNSLSNQLTIHFFLPFFSGSTSLTLTHTRKSDSNWKFPCWPWKENTAGTGVINAAYRIWIYPTQGDSFVHWLGQCLNSMANMASRNLYSFSFPWLYSRLLRLQSSLVLRHPGRWKSSLATLGTLLSIK